MQLSLDRRLPPQSVSRVDHRLHIGQQLLPLLRQTHAVAAPHQQGAAQLRLQAVYHVRHGRLGIAQLGRGLAKAAALYGRQQCPQLFIIHNFLTFPSVDMPVYFSQKTSNYFSMYHNSGLFSIPCLLMFCQLSQFSRKVFYRRFILFMAP